MAEVIYCDLRLQHTSEPKRRQKAGTSERKHPSWFKNPASPWKIITMILGIICLILISSVGLLAAKCNHFRSLLENQTSIPSALLGNNSSSKEENKRGWKHLTCSNNWDQHGENCYHFSRKMSVSKECPQLCTDLKSTFLKIRNEEEMNFVMTLSRMQCGMDTAKYWINLHYNSQKQQWMWQDGTVFSFYKFWHLGHRDFKNKCAYIQHDYIYLDDCDNLGCCVCKKTVYSV